MTAPLVELRCERHTYPDGTVGMHDVEFAVHADETVALVGGNGAGKSTLLEHLDGLLTPDHGELRVEGERVTPENVRAAREATGFVFQDADAQLVAPTVIDDVTFGPKNYGATDAEARDRAMDALERVDAAHLASRVPHHLSGGEKRLVALAGVLAMDPSVVLLDEPLTGLDPVRSRLVADRVRQLRDDGLGVVCATHDLDFAAHVADHVCVMDDGDVISRGSPRDVFYDDALLDRANLEPPTVVRLARRLGVADDRPITEAELAAALDGRTPVR
jgi:cobalt/nickel transport system ATP-binding protein